MIDGVDTPPVFEAAAKAAEARKTANPGIELLESVQFPLDAQTPPDISLDGDKVMINIRTEKNTHSPSYQSAIAHLQARGCNVIIDRESMVNPAKITITAPKSLFHPDTITALEAKQATEAIRAAEAAAARKAAGQKEFVPEYGC